jgi:hypothetical protein
MHTKTSWLITGLLAFQGVIHATPPVDTTYVEQETLQEIQEGTEPCQQSLQEEPMYQRDIARALENMAHGTSLMCEGLIELFQCPSGRQLLESLDEETYYQLLDVLSRVRGEGDRLRWAIQQEDMEQVFQSLHELTVIIHQLEASFFCDDGEENDDHGDIDVEMLK